jgi:CarboxypepD_reg-like domain
LRLYAVSFLLIFSYFSVDAQNFVRVFGKVTDQQTNQPLINANIIVDSTGEGVTTNRAGYYNIQLKTGKYKLVFSYVGYESQTKEINLPSKQKSYELNISLLLTAIKQGQVNIIGNKYPNSTVVREVEGENIRKMPTIFNDVLRSVKILPGVVSNDELSTGYNVRGGNYDQNLIYLNGYEIYRPFLVREGLEESQSILNPDLVKDIKFFGGAFPATLGDKLSSALEVEYKVPDQSQLEVNLGADLLHAGISGSKKFERWSIIGGGRYAYPSLFGNRLQRKGDYKPSFFDLQLLANYSLTENSSIEFLIVNAVNEYDLKPDNWKGNFQTSFLDVKEVSIDFNGERSSSFHTGLYGIVYKNKLEDDLFFSLSTSVLKNYEKERTNLVEDIYYSESAYNPDVNKLFLKNRFEDVNNSLDLSIYEIKPAAVLKKGVHTIESGLEFRVNSFKNSLYENLYEIGPDSTLELPFFRTGNQKYNFNSTAFYIQDDININKLFSMNTGVRLLYYNYNKEFMASPRASFYFFPNEKNTISLSSGFYYQPPFVYELRNNPGADEGLSAQKSLHILLGWDYRKSEQDRYQLEIFYKKNYDMIPYNIEKLQIQYNGTNELDGYAYGFDFQYSGEIVEGIKSWVGYSYLNAKEKPKDNSTGYRRSLLDQRHTFKVFLQDKIKRLPNFQSHVRLMFGTGMLYHPKISKIDAETGLTYLETDYSSVGVFPFYFRVDMGLSFKFDLDEKASISFIAEVLNVFDKNNIADYEYYTIYPITHYPIGIPQIFSKRFFNVGVNLNL